LKILGQIFRLGVKTLLMHGFTAAFADTDLSAESQAEIDTILKNADLKVDDLIETFNQGQLDAFPGRSIEETLELKILETLNKARNDAGRVVSKSLDETSNTLIMSKSGARGNIINLAQMAAVVGQQALRGKRIERGYKHRTLSCFAKGDLRSAQRGFINKGFRQGLSPHEFFFMAMTGRDSLMDTALRTPKSGYLYRRLANAMQDLKVEYDGTVRNASKKVIQFSYGEDGIDVSKSEGGKINVKRIIESVMEGN
jgi:DNA-directed RNA polymerase subunit A'